MRCNRLVLSCLINARCFVVGMSVLLPSQLLYGHHSHANLDRNNIQQHTGIVEEYSWTMPHVFLKVMAPNPNGDVVEYSIELVHPPGMLQRGWNKDTFKPGDRITWAGASDHNPQRYYSGLDWAEKADGTRFSTQKLVERIQPSTDFSGLWVRDLRGERPHYTPPQWPYTTLAQTEINQFDESQNPMLECIDPGPPKATLLPYPIRISRPDDKTIVMDYELRSEKRVIYLDDQARPAVPSTWGTSRGYFTDESESTLIVETTNFMAERWGSHTGVNSSSQKQLVERFTLSDDGLALNMEMTLTDPVYLLEPVTFDYHLAKIQDRELIQVECSTENARLFLEGGL